MLQCVNAVGIFVQTNTSDKHVRMLANMVRKVTTSNHKTAFSQAVFLRRSVLGKGVSKSVSLFSTTRSTFSLLYCDFDCVVKK